MAKDDEELGVGEFVSKYFDSSEVYLDEAQDFYKALGSRGMKMNTWNPVKIAKDIGDMQKRMDAKGISGNLRGDSVLLGGIMVCAPSLCLKPLLIGILAQTYVRAMRLGCMQSCLLSQTPLQVVNKNGPVSWVSYEDGYTMSFGKPFDQDELLKALAAAQAAA